MAISYKKLWKILIDRDMLKRDLEAEAGISHYVMNKMSRSEDVSTEVLRSICKVLDCSIDDIIDFIPDKQ